MYTSYTTEVFPIRHLLYLVGCLMVHRYSNVDFHTWLQKAILFSVLVTHKRSRFWSILTGCCHKWKLFRLFCFTVWYAMLSNEDYCLQIDNCNVLFRKFLLMSSKNIILQMIFCPLYFFLIFCWTKDHFVGPLIAPYFGLCMTLPMGFKVRVVLSPAHLVACVWWT